MMTFGYQIFLSAAHCVGATAGLEQLSPAEHIVQVDAPVEL
jgi:hypothetical protein